MISNGYRPKTVTVEALFSKGLLRGTVKEPKLNAHGAYFVINGELPDLGLTRKTA